MLRSTVEAAEQRELHTTRSPSSQAGDSVTRSAGSPAEEPSCMSATTSPPASRRNAPRAATGHRSNELRHHGVA